MVSKHSPLSPLISVLLPAYNGARFIGDAIQSVLEQTFPNFELLIVDDGSTDDTAEVVGAFDDERIRVCLQSNNGSSHAINRAVSLARGPYVACMAQDDVCHRERLEHEYRFLVETGKRAVFSWAAFIDDEGDSLHDTHFANDYFNHPNRSRAEILRWFFFEGNYFCAPSCLVEKELLRETGLVVPTLAQLPDFSMWIRILKRTDLVILPEKLLKFRIRANGENASSPKNAIRADFERQQVYREMFDDVAAELFRSAFLQYLRDREFSDDASFELEKSFLYLQHPSNQIQSIGAERLYRQLQDEVLLHVAVERYNFGLAAFHSLSSTMDFASAGLLRAEREYSRQKEAELWAVLERYRGLEEELKRVHAGYQAELRRLHEELAGAQAARRAGVEADNKLTASGT